MKNTLIKGALLGVGLATAQSAIAAPILWESNFGSQLSSISQEDDAVENVALSFLFPFMGSKYKNFGVGTNGGVQALGAGSTASEIAPDLWQDMSGFLQAGSPMFLPFNTDLSTEQSGNIYFNDFGDRAVFTWDQVGAALDETETATFQLQMLLSGHIIFNYNGIGQSFLANVGEGILSGISGGRGGPQSNLDLSGASSGGFNTSQSWCDDWSYDCDQYSSDTNDAFDLNMRSIVFNPTANGFSISDSIELNSVPEPGTMVLLATGMLLVARRRYTKGC